MKQCLSHGAARVTLRLSSAHFGALQDAGDCPAKHVGLPDKGIRQRPSPGFGGIYDEEILGPYELAGQVFAVFEPGHPDEEIADRAASRRRGTSRAEAKRPVRFLKALSRCAAQKNRNPQSCPNPRHTIHLELCGQGL